MGKAEWASICQYEDDDGYYLFFGYSENQMSDTYHSSLDETEEQAEFEYRGVSNTWYKSQHNKSLQSDTPEARR